MNESFKRITEWAKAHPALAVGIVAVLVVVGYLVYKKVGTSGSAVTTPADSSGVTTGGGGGDASLPTMSDLIPNIGDGGDYFQSGTIPDAVVSVVPTSSYANSPTGWGEIAGGNWLKSTGPAKSQTGTKSGGNWSNGRRLQSSQSGPNTTVTKEGGSVVTVKTPQAGVKTGSGYLNVVPQTQPPAGTKSGGSAWTKGGSSSQVIPQTANQSKVA